MQTDLFTRVDVVEHLLDVLNTGSSDARTLRLCKRAVESAYRELPTLRKWSYYYGVGRLLLDEAYTTGTIEYDHTGGASERMVTLTTGTWPTWAKFGFIRIDSVDYEIATRESSSIITLSVNSNPGSDVASGETYELFRDTYPLPVDFSSMGFIRDPVNTFSPEFLNPADWIALKLSQEGEGQPRNYTIVADQNYVGTMAIKFYPPPDDAYNFEYQYIRRPRPFSTYQEDTGTIATSGTTVTGTSTAFSVNMIGCVLRRSTSATLAPTGPTGTNPYDEQRIITGYSSATSITIDQAFTAEASGVKFEVSDLIDIEAGAMYTAFLKRAEWELAQLLNRDDTARFAQQMQQAQIQAFEADNRTYQPHGEPLRRRTPLRFDVTNG